MSTEVPLHELNEQENSNSTPPFAGAAEEEDGENSLLDLFIVLAERKRLIFSVTATFAILAVVISLVLPKRYTATVTLLSPQQNNSMASALTSQLGSLGGMAALAGGSLGLKNPNDMFVAMFKSRTVEDAMIQRFGLMQEYQDRYLTDARARFEHYATVNGSGKDGLIHISVEDRDPQRAAELANGYVDQFRNLSQHLAITEAEQRRSFFEQQLKQANQNLADAEEALKETEQKTGLIQLDSQARALIESAATLRAQITAREVQIQGMQTYATGENAQLIQAQKELDSMRAQLAQLGGSGESTNGVIVPKGQMTESGLEYVRRLRDVKYYETIFEILARQFELAKLDEAKEGAVIQVVDPAVAPDSRSFPKRGVIVVVATLIGFVIAIILVFVLAKMRSLGDDPESLEKVARIRNALALRRSGKTPL